MYLDPSRTIQYESIQIIYNLVQMDKKWIFSSKKIISMLLNIWTGPQYKVFIIYFISHYAIK